MGLMLFELFELFSYSATVVFYTAVVVGFYCLLRFYSSTKACFGVVIIFWKFLQTHPEVRKRQLFGEIMGTLNFRLQTDPLVMAPFYELPYIQRYYAVEKCMIIFYTTLGEHYMITKRNTEDEEAARVEDEARFRAMRESLLNQRVTELENRAIAAENRVAEVEAELVQARVQIIETEARARLDMDLLMDEMHGY